MERAGGAHTLEPKALLIVYPPGGGVLNCCMKNAWSARQVVWLDEFGLHKSSALRVAAMSFMICRRRAGCECCQKDLWDLCLIAFETFERGYKIVECFNNENFVASVFSRQGFSHIDRDR